jgi:hypothetical protein
LQRKLSAEFVTQLVHLVTSLLRERESENKREREKKGKKKESERER